MLRVETWKYGWRWVYSVTYDEGVPTLLQHALPLHRKHAMPGTVALDAERYCRRRRTPSKAQNDGEHERYLNLNEVRELQRHGWSVAGLGPIRGQDGDRAPTRGAPTVPDFADT